MSEGKVTTTELDFSTARREDSDPNSKYRRIIATYHVCNVGHTADEPPQGQESASSSRVPEGSECFGGRSGGPPMIGQGNTEAG